MSAKSYAFDTSIGSFIATEDSGAIVGLRLSAGEQGGSYDAPSALLAEAESQITQYLGGQRREFDLPIEARGSDFENRVWDYLKTIPYGQRRTYGEVAIAIGSQGAARAVGTACGKNPVLVAVPCHRVVGAGGRLGGYVGGANIKERLLALETENLNAG
jgi:methylated-DNA-[protein]-cysteine S-methyltransferase